MKNKKNWLLIFILILVLFGVWQLLSHYFSEHEKQIRRQVRETVADTFPELAEKYSLSLGLFPYEGNVFKNPPRRNETIVLIHGLDDPGKVWMNLAPTLVARGFDVLLMNYPNDQPVTDSTELFLGELIKLRDQNTRRISIVAHSMGGLITRDLLTSPEIGYDRLLEQQLVPEVDQFIMVGTPNHGSQIARFRALGELRDQFDRLMKGEINGLGFILDGAGEAKIDLLPGSRFLNTLNKRPHPEGVTMLIIAGIAVPWNQEDLKGWLGALERTIGENRRSEVEQLGEFINSMSYGLGDGLVTVQSTLLPGVEHLKVNGTHLSMIRNITTASERVPPAVPIIVEKLMVD